MKILQINSVCGFGSTGRIATDLYKVYEEAGHECVIAYGRGSAPEGYNTIKIGSNMDNYIHVAKTRIFDKHGFGSKRATEKFIHDVKKLNPDVIHLHNIHGYYINIEILFNYLKEANKKVIWTLHDCWSFTGHCAYFDYINCDKWKSGCEKCPQKKAYPTSNLLDSSELNYKIKKEIFTGIEDMIIVTPSEWLAKIVRKSFLKKYDVNVIHNGIDLNIFKPTQNNFKVENNIKGKKMILGVANVWEPRKGLDYIINLSKVLDENYKVVVVGLNKEQKRRLPENIIGIERTDTTEKLAMIYSAADVFLNPTLEETLGMTNIEAMACGTFVLTFNTGGCPETINKDSGKIILKDIENIKCNIEVILKEGYKAKRCIQRARIFSKDLKNKEYLELF